MEPDLWTSQGEVIIAGLQDFEVEASDDHIGKVDEATYDVGSSYIVVDTGPWILGKKVMLPAGTIDRIDFDEKTIHVDRSQEEIKNAPEFDPSGYAEQEYRLALAEYYSGFYV